MKKYFYPAVFTPEDNNAYSVSFPDLPGCFTSGESLEDAFDMAQDALCLTLYDMEESGKPIPSMCDVASIPLEDGQFVAVIGCDTLEYRKFFENKAVKKTLTIPAWLNTAAERQGVNFSAILQDALKQHLHVN